MTKMSKNLDIIAVQIDLLRDSHLNSSFFFIPLPLNSSTLILTVALKLILVKAYLIGDYAVLYTGPSPVLQYVKRTWTRPCIL